VSSTGTGTGRGTPRWLHRAPRAVAGRVSFWEVVAPSCLHPAGGPVCRDAATHPAPAPPPCRRRTHRRGAVNGIAVHPSGRIAVSVGHDRVLAVWDLTKCKAALRTKLLAEGTAVAWNEDGTAFAVLFEAAAIVYDGGSGVEKATLKPAGAVTKLTCLTWLRAGGKDVVAVGTEAGDVCVFTPDGAASRNLATGHGRRVRCMAVCDGAPDASARHSAAGGGSAGGAAGGAGAPAAVGLPPSASGVSPLSSLAAASKERIALAGSGAVLFTVDSDGIVKAWDAAAVVADAASAACLATMSAGRGCRPTCIAATYRTAAAAAAAAPSTGSGGGVKAAAAAPSKAKLPAAPAAKGASKPAVASVPAPAPAAPAVGGKRKRPDAVPAAPAAAGGGDDGEGGATAPPPAKRTPKATVKVSMGGSGSGTKAAGGSGEKGVRRVRFSLEKDEGRKGGKAGGKGK
jgi:hypothetical protein